MAEWNEHVLKVRAGLDKASKEEMLRAVKEVFTEGAVVDFSNKQNLKALQEFAEAMQKIFSKVGSTKDFTKMMKLPGPEMFAELKQAAIELEKIMGSVASSFGAVGSAFSDGIVNGVSDATKQLEAEFDNLIKTRAAKMQELEKLQSKMRKKEDMEKRLFFNPYDSKRAPVDKNFAQHVSDAIDEYYEVSEALETAIDNDKVTEPILQQWTAVASKLREINNTIEDMGSISAKKILGNNLKFFTDGEYDDAISLGMDAIDDFIDTEEIVDRIEIIQKSIKDLDVQIDSLTDKHPELISEKAVSDAEDKLKRIQKAYGELFYKRDGKDHKKGEKNLAAIQQIENVLTSEGKGAKIKDISVDATKRQLELQKKAISVAHTELEEQFRMYDEKSAKGEWLESSKYLIRAITEYESILNNPNADKEILEGYRGTYEKMKAQEAAVREDLQTLLAMTKGDGSKPDAESNPKDIVEVAKKSRDYAEEELKIKQATLEVENQATELDTVTDDDVETIAKENGALEDKLELLQEIAEQYGNNISQKQRDSYERLNQKDMDSGLTEKEEERYWELGEQIDEADRALEEFGETYDKIIVKLGNGKNVEILPDDKGLRTLAKIDEEYGESYNGVEIEDVVFERVKQEVVETKQSVDDLNESLEQTKQLTSGGGVGDASSSELEAEKVKAESLQNELDKKNAELVEKDNEIQRAQSEKDVVIQTANAEKEALQNELDAATQLNSSVRQQLLDTRDDWVMAEQRASAAEEKVAQLEQRLAESMGDGEQQGSVSMEELRTLLDSIVYNVKIAYDDNDKKANKISLDESVLENVLKRVFADIRKPDDESSQSEPKSEPWALEKTLLGVKEVLNIIRDNTSKADSIEIAPAKPEVGNVLATESTLAAIKTAVEAINKKTKTELTTSTQTQPTNRFVAPNSKPTNVKDAQSLIRSYETLGRLRAKFETDGDVEARAQLQVLADEVARKRESLALTEEEIIVLRNKSRIAYESEKKLLDAAKQKRQSDETQKRIAQEKAAAEKAAEKAAKDSLQAAKKQLADDKKLKKRQAMTGKAGSAIGRGESVWLEAEDLDKTKLPQAFKDQIKEQRQALDELILKLHEVNTAKEISDEQVKGLRAQTAAVNKQTEAVGRLVAEYQKLSGDNVDESMSRATTLGASSSLSDYKNQMTDYVREITNGKGKVKEFSNETKTLTYTVKTGTNEFTEYTVAVRNLDHQLVSVQGTTKRTETFFEATARKMKELTTYFSGMAVLNFAKQELRRGIQYVREIDLALTELKKVTDETEESYDKFLETASKTAAKVGSTIKDVISSTADWARLNI